MRIRTDGDKAFRKDVIEGASDFYSVNKTRSIVFACHDIPGLVSACERVLNRDDLTAGQKREIAETLNDNVRGVTFRVEETVAVEKDD